MQNQKKVWENIWEKTGNTLNYKDTHYLMDEIKLEYLLPLLKSQMENGGSSKTLEVGCGSARLSCFLASKKFDTTCLDYSENALTVAKRNYSITGNEGNFVKGDATNLPFKDNSFDVILSTGLLEHFEDPKVVINEMVRVLKPGGIFYSDIVPKKFSLFRAYKLIKKGTEELYEIELNSEDIKEMLNSAKLENICVFPAGVFLPPLPYSNKFNSLKRIEYNLLRGLKPLIKSLDDSFIAEWAGFYYFAHAKKPKD